MVKISILYPHQDNEQFDFDYYIKVHMPRSIELLRTHHGFRAVSVERGASGTIPGSAPAFVAMCHFQFTSVETFLDAFMPHAAALQADIPNYTNTMPVIQVNEILIEVSA